MSNQNWYQCQISIGISVKSVLESVSNQYWCFQLPSVDEAMIQEKADDDDDDDAYNDNDNMVIFNLWGS